MIILWGKTSEYQNNKDNGITCDFSENRWDFCIKGEYLFQEYANINGKVFDEYGWFHTGDIGLIRRWFIFIYWI